MVYDVKYGIDGMSNFENENIDLKSKSIKNIIKISKFCILRSDHYDIDDRIKILKPINRKSHPNSLNFKSCNYKYQIFKKKRKQKR